MEWVRLYHDMPTDPKWRVIAKKAGQRIGDVIAVYTFMLTNASGNTTKRGVTHNLVTEDIAAAIDLGEADVGAILGAMEGKVVLNGELLGWEKRNPIREDNSTERVRKHRETQRNAVKRPDKTRTEEDIEKKESSLAASQPPAKPARKSSTPIPDNFPSPEQQDEACVYWDERDRQDLSVAVMDEAAKFRDHHVSHGSRMSDWPAAWRTWFRNAIKFNRKPGNGKSDATGKRSSTDKHLDGIASLIAERRQIAGGNLS